MPDRTLTCQVGGLHFAWLTQVVEIEVYRIDEGTTRPRNRLGFLTNKAQEGGGLVEFEQAAFEDHCQWFVAQAGEADVRGEKREES